MPFVVIIVVIVVVIVVVAVVHSARDAMAEKNFSSFNGLPHTSSAPLSKKCSTSSSSVLPVQPKTCVRVAVMSMSTGVRSCVPA